MSGVLGLWGLPARIPLFRSPAAAYALPSSPIQLGSPLRSSAGTSEWCFLRGGERNPTKLHVGPRECGICISCNGQPTTKVRRGFRTISSMKLSLSMLNSPPPSPTSVILPAGDSAYPATALGHTVVYGKGVAVGGATREGFSV